MHLESKMCKLSFLGVVMGYEPFHIFGIIYIILLSLSQFLLIQSYLGLHVSYDFCCTG